MSREGMGHPLGRTVVFPPNQTQTALYARTHASSLTTLRQLVHTYIHTYIHYMHANMQAA